MPNTYTQIYIQFVFAVKYRESLIKKEWKDELYKYITAIVQNNKSKMLAINGMTDHIHILRISFKDEYVRFLKDFAIEYDEKYLFDFYNDLYSTPTELMRSQ